MTKTPAVSVILPTYNRSAVLGRSVQSVLSQSFTDFELILVDDASQDETESVVKAFDDSRIRYVKTEKNFGGAEARNIGMRLAQASLIAFQDSDDEWRPEKLSTCITILNNERNCIGVFSGFWQICDRKSRYMPTSDPPNDRNSMFSALLRNNFVDTPTVVVRRNALDAVGGFDPAMPRYQDWDLAIRLSSIGQMVFIKEPLILSYITPSSISLDIYAHRDALERIFRKNAEKILLDDKLHAVWLSRLGDAQIRTGKINLGRRNLFSALRYRPLYSRHVVKAFFSAPGSAHVYKILCKLFEQSRF